MARKSYLKAIAYIRKEWKRIPRGWRFAFSYLAVAAFAVATDKLSEGGGPMYLIAAAFLLVFGFVLHMGHRNAAKKKVSGLYWHWVGLSATFLIAIMIAKACIVKSYSSQIAKQKEKLAWFTNALSQTNSFYIGILSQTNDYFAGQFIKQDNLINELRLLVANKSGGTFSPAALMGFHDQTNYIELTNFTIRAISYAALTNEVKFDSNSRDKMAIDALALNAPVPGYYYLEASFYISNNLPYAPYETSFNFSPGMIGEYGPITVIDEQNKTNISQLSAAGEWSNSGNSTAVHSIHKYSLHLNVAYSNTIIRPFLQKMPFNGQIIFLDRGSCVQLTKLPSITDVNASQAGK